MKIITKTLILCLLLLNFLDSTVLAGGNGFPLVSKTEVLPSTPKPIETADLASAKVEPELLANETVESKLFREIAKKHRFLRASFYTGLAVGLRSTDKTDEEGYYVYEWETVGGITAASLHYDLKAYWSIFIFYGTLSKVGEYVHQTGGLGTDYRDALNLTVAVGIDYYSSKEYRTWDFIYFSFGWTWGGVLNVNLTNLDITEEDIRKDLERLP